jgi:hypothetical protein
MEIAPPVHPVQITFITKKDKPMKSMLLIIFGVISMVAAESTQPRTHCRFVPERLDDFAWENDKVAFRAYGPAARKRPENSGFDCWLKRVDYPVVDKWYAQMRKKSYHKDWGEGHDPYHVGSSRGCGGLGLWLDEELVISETFVSWKILKCEPQESVFVLTYEWKHAEDTYKEDKQISIELGARLFKSVSTFWKNGELAISLPIAIGITTHDGKATPSKNVVKGWMACWEKIEGYGVGTGVVIDPAKIDGFKHTESKKKDESHALFITKTDAEARVEYHAGYGWEKAGEIKTSKDWNTYLSEQ